MRYGVINKLTGAVVGDYHADAPNYADPFGPQSDVVHFEMTEEQHLAGFSLNEGYVAVYDTNFVPYAGTYKTVKRYRLLEIQEFFREHAVEFAADNSEILNIEIARKAAAGDFTLSDPAIFKAELEVFVRSKLDPLVDTLHNLMSDMESFYTWRIAEHLDAIPREPLIATEERITEFKALLLAEIAK